MIVVSDTSPLNYLVLVDADRFLPDLFGQVAAPPAVLAEMQHARTPARGSRRRVPTHRSSGVSAHVEVIVCTYVHASL